jgi:hypothetical protein
MDATIFEAHNVHRHNNRLSATFTPSEELNSPVMNVRRKDKVLEVRERLNHVLSHDATFNNLKQKKKGNILDDVV